MVRAMVLDLHDGLVVDVASAVRAAALCCFGAVADSKWSSFGAFGYVDEFDGRVSGADVGW